MKRNGFVEVSESPGSRATREQISMLYTRYHRARELGRGRDVLEVACGPAFGARYLSQAAKRYVATDGDPEFVAQVRERHGGSVEIQQVDAQVLPFESSSFDVILILEAIYYLPAPEKFVAEATRVLRPGGTLLVVSANPERRAFNPGAKTSRYLTASQLASMMEAHGLAPRAFGAFPESATGVRAMAARIARFVGVTMKLIPATMKAKEGLKRVFFGPLVPLPADITENMAPLARLAPLGKPPHHEYAVIYVEGTKPASQAV